VPEYRRIGKAVRFRHGPATVNSVYYKYDVFKRPLMISGRFECMAVSQETCLLFLKVEIPAGRVSSLSRVD